MTMSTNTNRFYLRRTVLGAFCAVAMMAVASDASAAPLTDAEVAAFNAGPAKHVAGSPLNSRIPQGATSPGFKLTLTRKAMGTLGNVIEVKTNGQVFIPPYAYNSAELCRPTVCAPGQRWQILRKQYAGGFVNVNMTDVMSAGAQAIVHRAVNVPGAADVNLTLTFNAASDPKTVLVQVTMRDPDYGPAPIVTVQDPPRPIKYEEKPQGGAFVYAIQPAPAGGGGA